MLHLNLIDKKLHLNWQYILVSSQYKLGNQTDTEPQGTAADKLQLLHLDQQYLLISYQYKQSNQTGTEPQGTAVNHRVLL